MILVQPEVSHYLTKETKFSSASHKKIPYVKQQRLFPLPPDNLYCSNGIPLNMQNNYKYVLVLYCRIILLLGLS